MQKLTLLALAVALLAGCGGGSGTDPQPPANRPDQVIIVNRASGITLDRVLLEAFELGNIIIGYTTIDLPLNVPTGFAQVLDQATVDAFFAGIPGPAGMDTHLFYGTGTLEFALEDLTWNPGEGTFVAQIIRNPNFPADPDEFLVTELAPAVYLNMLATGEIQEL